jgi:hypothetical protein
MAKTTAMNEPITIPAMEPPEIVDPEDVGMTVDVELVAAAEGVAVRDMETSEGKPWKGLKEMDVFRAYTS